MLHRIALRSNRRVQPIATTCDDAGRANAVEHFDADHGLPRRPRQLERRRRQVSDRYGRLQHVGDRAAQVAPCDVCGEIDHTLGLLAEKTKGNLTPAEENFLQNCLYELRMAYVEVTNALARPPQATGTNPAKR